MTAAKKDEIPAAIRIYQFHKVKLAPAKNKKGEWTGTCFNCGKDAGNKFLVNDITGQHNCVACGVRGNPATFLRWLFDTGRNQTTAADYTALAKQRKILKGETCRAWGCFKHPLTGEWAIPGWTADDRLVGVYRYEPQADGKHILKATPKAEEPVNAGGHGMFRPVDQLLSKKTYTGWDVTEGPWDGMAFWEAGRLARETGGGWEVTAVADNSYLASRAVISSPGVQTFFRQWAGLMAGADVRSYFDNDYPKVNKQTNRPLEPAALAGTRRLVETLSITDTPPASISCVRWGGAGGDWQDPDLPDGYDVRDCLTADGSTAAARVRAFGELLSRLAPVPAEWTPDKVGGGGNGEPAKAAPELAYCDNYKDLVMACRKAMTWGEGLDRTLSVMLATILSTDAAGDQLWVRVLGLPSCGKTSLAEAVGTNTEHIKIVSKINGLYSAKNDGTGKNYSLALQLNHKTLIIKDADTIKADPNKYQLMSEFRDLYDRTGGRSTRNGMDTDIKDHAMTVIFCGTPDLREMDTNDRGQRFLDVIVLDRIDVKQERDTAIGNSTKTFAMMKSKPAGEEVSAASPKDEMKRVAGGYAAYLRRNETRLIDAVEEDVRMHATCADLGMYVSYCRARKGDTDAPPVRELSYRLGSQLTRLAVCLAAVRNKVSMGDDDVKRIVVQVAFDTARGPVERFLKVLFEAGTDGLRLKEVASRCSTTPHKAEVMLGFLKELGEEPVQSYARARRIGTGAFGEARYDDQPENKLTYWRLNGWMRELYARVHGLDPHDDGYSEEDPSEQE